MSDPIPTTGANATPLAAVRISLRWRDLDAFEHVNNAVFLTYLEEARLRWLAGIDGEWKSATALPVVAATHVNYRKQLQWPGDVVVELRAERIGATSLTIAHRIVAAADATRVHADGTVVMVWIDAASGRAIPLPDAVRAAAG